MKPGWQTSELWVAVAGAVTMSLNGKLGLNLQASDVIAIGAVVVSFVASRWHLKHTEMMASVGAPKA